MKIDGLALLIAVWEVEMGEMEENYRLSCSLEDFSISSDSHFSEQNASDRTHLELD